MRLKDISILNLFEQIQENTIAGSAFSARLGSSAVAFIPDQKFYLQYSIPVPNENFNQARPVLHCFGAVGNREI